MGGDRTITEQPLSAESSTPGTVTPDKTPQDFTSESSNLVTEQAEEIEVQNKGETQETIETKSEAVEIETQGTVETESMQSSSAVMPDSTDPKIEVSSEEGSYDVIKHKELESEGESARPASPQDDEDFEKELDQMIENINDGEPIPSDIDQDGDWEDWD